MKKQKTACVVVGAMGRMGQRICHLLSASDDFILAGATEGPHSPYLGKSLKDAMGLPGDAVFMVERPEEVTADFEAIIDFTFPEISMKTAAFAGREKKCAVIGSTGFSPEQMQELKTLTRQFPCVCAPNMSLGVTTLFKLVQDVAKILKDGFDVEVVEIHHRHKKDAPSGTAVKIAEILAQAYGWNLEQAGVYQRRGFIG
ncbi:MAG: 4-hydroxy-tetrahydrodipicolinate reductase, partial [Pseudomonadota bacterium]